MPAERVAALEELAHASPYWDQQGSVRSCNCATT